jgi:hypothetical protein
VVSPKEWEKVENVNQVLAVFNDVKTLFLEVTTLHPIYFCLRCGE